MLHRKRMETATFFTIATRQFCLFSYWRTTSIYLFFITFSYSEHLLRGRQFHLSIASGFLMAINNCAKAIFRHFLFFLFIKLCIFLFTFIKNQKMQRKIYLQKTIKNSSLNTILPNNITLSQSQSYMTVPLRHLVML